MTFYGSNQEIAQYVNVLLRHLKPALRSITITPKAGSEDFCATIAIAASSADIAKRLARTYSLQLMITLPPST